VDGSRNARAAIGIRRKKNVFFVTGIAEGKGIESAPKKLGIHSSYCIRDCEFF